MIISDLNYVEVVTEASEVIGGGDVSQRVTTTQNSTATVGAGTSRNSFLNTAVSLPISLNTLTAISLL